MEVHITNLDSEFENLSRKKSAIMKKLERSRNSAKRINLEKEIAQIEKKIALISKKIKN